MTTNISAVQSKFNLVETEKIWEFRRVFEKMPNVLIQDPARECAYYIKAEKLQPFIANPQSWASLGDNTVTFIIPGNELIDEVPPFLLTPEIEPSILIRYPLGKLAFILSFDDLQSFKIPQPEESFDANCVSFIIPKGTELIEELPTLRRALLQSNTG